ncbi:MFS transporter [Gordonia hankookensis]|uniref:MFS transporter n=1 Tax=Gordonia hankookensis TaxID=589403 RepID=A0ABR7WAW2_9ACTN|nr:MFS transporter [Gordonia hankookensis]MBD1319945.1 MFS transporter [Gordonia hankookensis]
MISDQQRADRQSEGTETTKDRIGARGIWLMCVACGALSVVAGAMTALNVALPEIGPSIGASSTQMTWLVDAYTVALAALLLPCGALGDRYGRRGLLVVGLVVFAIASLPPLWIDDPMIVIASRALAGVAAAMIMPATLSLLTSELPESRRPLAVAIWAGVAGAGSIGGFFVSGFLLEWFTWRSIFVTFAAVTFVLAVASCTIATSRDDEPRRFDFPGALLSTSAVFLFVLGLLESPSRGWDDAIVIGALAAGLVLAVVFAFVEYRRDAPLLDVRLFSNRAFSAGAFTILVQFFASLGLFFVVLQRLQLDFGMSPLMAATAMLPLIAVIMVLSPIGGWLAVRYSLRTILVLGVGLTGVALILMGVLDYSSYLSLLPLLLLGSAGQGFATAPPTTAIMANTPSANQGVGSAVNDTFREVGAAIGIALAGSIVAAGYSRNIAPIADKVAATTGSAELGDHISRSLAEALHALDALVTQYPAQAGALGQVADQARHAFVAPLNTACIVMGVVILVGAAVLAFLSPDAMTPAADEPAAEPERQPAAR